MTVKRRLQMDAFVSGLLPTVAFDVRRARLAHGATVLALRNGPALLIDVLKRAICMKASWSATKLLDGFEIWLGCLRLYSVRRRRGALRAEYQRWTPGLAANITHLHVGSC